VKDRSDHETKNQHMKILVLDGQTLFQQDIDRSAFDRFGEVVFRDRTSRDDLASCEPGAEILITNKSLIGLPELAHFRSLKLVVVSATGYNCVDVRSCTELGIPVCNVPDYGTFSVAQHALAMMLHHSNQVGLHAASVRRGDWSSCPDFSYTLTPISEWHGKTLGILGMGNIGSCLAGMAESLGMKVIYHHTRDLQLKGRSFVGLDELASTSDVVSLHCPLVEKTDRIINEWFLAMMQPHALLINTARGGLVDNLALERALKERRIAAALLDVLEKEPPSADHPLTGLPNAVITPHIAWISFEARKRILAVMLQILEGYPSGHLIHRVN
jgi:glycerate dehydrogenase